MEKQNIYLNLLLIRLSEIALLIVLFSETFDFFAQIDQKVTNSTVSTSRELIREELGDWGVELLVILRFGENIEGIVELGLLNSLKLLFVLLKKALLLLEAN